MDFRNGLASLGALALLTGCMSEDASDTNNLLRVGVYENEPKVFTHSDGRPDGLFVDILDAIAAEEGWSLDYVPCVWEQCLDMLDNGELDLMPYVAWSRDRLERFNFHQIPVTQAWSQIYATRAQPIFSFDDLDGLTIAVVPGSVQASVLQNLADDQGLDLTLLNRAGFDESFTAVEQGEADATVANNFFGSRNRGLYGLVETPVNFDQVGLFYAAPGDTGTELLDTIDACLDSWQEDSSSPFYAAMSRAVFTPESVRIPLWVWGLALAFFRWQSCWGLSAPCSNGE